MQAAAWIALAIVLAAVGCGARAAQDTQGSGSGGESASDEAAARSARAASESAWLRDVPPSGILTYEVTLGPSSAPVAVQMQVQEIVRRDRAIAIRLAPIGTPLADEQPVFARWLVGEETALVGLDATAALTTEAGYAPIDEAGHMRTEAGENIAWRLPLDWLTPGRVVAGEEASAGWRLAERIGDVTEPLTAHGCARLEREEAGARATLIVCAGIGLVDATRTGADGAIAERWRLVSIAGPPADGAETR